MLITDDDIAEFINNEYQLMPFCRKAVQSLLDELFKREARDFVSQFDGQVLPTGHKRVVLSGSYPRTLLTPVGDVSLNIPKVRFRSKLEGDTTQFQPTMLPRYLRKMNEVEDIIPFLYLKGISTTEFSEAFKQLYGMHVQGMSPKTISTLIHSWTDEFKEWSQRDLGDSLEYPYVFADGIFFPIRGEEEHQVILTLIGVNSEGRKELLSLGTGFAERSENWKALLLDLKERGLKNPKLFVGDAGLGLWSGLREVFPDCARQTCWEHKIRNVQSHLPKSLRFKSRQDLKEIYMSESRSAAERQIKLFANQYGSKYPKALKSLETHKQHLLTFYSFPAEHWAHIRTTNIIESIFATVRNRTNKMRGIGNINTLSAMVFKLVGMASKNFRKITSAEILQDVLKGEKFVDGIQEKKKSRK
jgi:transposase-like protein